MTIGVALRAHVRPGCIGIVEDFERGGRRSGVAHDVLGERLAAFDAGRGLRRAEDTQFFLSEAVHDANGERQLWSDDGEVDAVLAHGGN